MPSGRLEAYYENNLIGWADVSNNSSKINLTIPMLSAEYTYNVNFKYIASNNSNYANAVADSILSIKKQSIVIEPRIDTYYPNYKFDYKIDLYDQDGHTIDFGQITLYIDNVEIITKQVHMGYVCISNLFFDTVQSYNFELIYEENDFKWK